MAGTSSHLLRWARNTILGTLLALAAVAWALLSWQSAIAEDTPMGVTIEMG